MPCNFDVGGSNEMCQCTIGLKYDHDILTLSEVTRESKGMSAITLLLDLQHMCNLKQHTVIRKLVDMSVNNCCHILQ